MFHDKILRSCRVRLEIDSSEKLNVFKALLTNKKFIGHVKDLYNRWVELKPHYCLM